MAILNPNFAAAGAAPGKAAGWTLFTSVAAERIAGFGPEPIRAWEDFERWFALRLSLGTMDGAFAYFDGFTEAFEDFAGWVARYLTELPGGHAEPAPIGQDGVETFAAGWDGDAYVFSWEQAQSIAAGAPEAFESGWAHAYAWAWSALSSSPAVFTGSEPTETFGGSWAHATAI